MCFNRTFMELKSQGLRNGIGAVLGFNRTFMELKSFNLLRFTEES